MLVMKKVGSQHLHNGLRQPYLHCGHGDVHPEFLSLSLGKNPVIYNETTETGKGHLGN